jgi:hypothetical protein
MNNLSESELTNLLIGKYFCAPLKGMPLFWKSLVSGNEYDYTKYTNHGYGGIKQKKWIDLPKEEYPFTVVYSK